MAKMFFTIFFFVATYTVSAQKAKDFGDLGNKSMESGDYISAIQSFTKAIQLSPSTAEYYHNRAVSYHAIEKYQEALIDFNKALSIEKTTESYNAIGMTFFYLNKFPEAISNFNKALELDKNNALTFYNLGLAYGNLNNYENALKYFNDALKINPKYEIALLGRVIALVKLQKFDEALSDLNSLEKKYPNDLEITSYKATCLYETKNFSEAITEYSKLIYANPHDADLFWHRAASYSFTNQTNEAINDYSRILELLKNTDSKDFISITYYYRGKVYTMNANYQSAVKDFDECLKINSTAELALFYRAICKLELKQVTEACVDYKNAIRNGFQNSFDYKNIILTYSSDYFETKFGSCK
ncbi:MAG: tetratricopeptide repeat protein [Ginsengibacter sp.]